MKKLSYLLGSCMLIFILESNMCPKKPNNQSSGPASPGITLSGETQAQASNMVAAFVNDNTSSSAASAVCLTSVWLDNVISLLTSEQKVNGLPKGIRIYFAKQTNAPHDNTIVIVSTEDSVDANHVSKGVHTDYFSHPGLNGSLGLKIDDCNGKEKGASLFIRNTGITTPCTYVTNSSHTISPDSAFKCVDSLRAHGAKQGINTSSEWFPLSVLINLQQQLKDAAQDQKVPTKPDGIRIYFGRHSLDAHRYRHCFVIVPTKIDANPRTDDFTCHTVSNKKGDPIENGEECPNNCDGVSLPQQGN